MRPFDVGKNAEVPSTVVRFSPLLKGIVTDILVGFPSSRKFVCFQVVHTRGVVVFVPNPKRLWSVEIIGVGNIDFRRQ